jgi:hypothetical protein
MVKTVSLVLLSSSLFGVMGAETQCTADPTVNSNCQDTTAMLQSRTQVMTEVATQITNSPKEAAHGIDANEGISGMTLMSMEVAKDKKMATPKRIRGYDYSHQGTWKSYGDYYDKISTSYTAWSDEKEGTRSSGDHTMKTYQLRNLCASRCDVDAACLGFSYGSRTLTVGINSSWISECLVYTRIDRVDDGAKQHDNYNQDYVTYMITQSPNTAAAGGTCTDPDPNTKGTADWKCSGLVTKSPAEPNGVCTDWWTCQTNCCQEATTTTTTTACPNGKSHKNRRRALPLPQGWHLCDAGFAPKIAGQDDGCCQQCNSGLTWRDWHCRDTQDDIVPGYAPTEGVFSCCEACTDNCDKCNTGPGKCDWDGCKNGYRRNYGAMTCEKTCTSSSDCPEGSTCDEVCQEARRRRTRRRSWSFSFSPRRRFSLPSSFFHRRRHFR